MWQKDSQTIIVPLALRDMKENTVKGVQLVTMATQGCQVVAVRSVSVPHGGRYQDRVTLSRASALAGLGHLEFCVTSAWIGMFVDLLGSSLVTMSVQVC